MKKLIAEFPKYTSIKELDQSIKKLLQNFDPEQTVEITMDEDSKSMFIYIDKDTDNKKPDLKVVKWIMNLKKVYKLRTSLNWIFRG